MYLLKRRQIGVIIIPHFPVIQPVELAGKKHIAVIRAVDHSPLKSLFNWMINVVVNPHPSKVVGHDKYLTSHRLRTTNDSSCESAGSDAITCVNDIIVNITIGPAYLKTTSTSGRFKRPCGVVENPKIRPTTGNHSVTPSVCVGQEEIVENENISQLLLRIVVGDKHGGSVMDTEIAAHRVPIDIQSVHHDGRIIGVVEENYVIQVVCPL